MSEITISIGKNAEGGISVWVRPMSDTGGEHPEKCKTCKQGLEGDYRLLKKYVGQVVKVEVDESLTLA